MHKLTIKINKMRCTWCADHIKAILLNSFKAKDVKINVKDQIVKFVLMGKVDRDRLKKEIIKRGYGDIEFID